MAGQAKEGRTPEEIEAARKLFAGPCEFVSGAASLASLPPATLPEIAFAGRSNVGKSSLVNALTGRRTLARVSAKPGHTRQINFFDLAGRLFLVDLPGYGFAQVSRSMKETWQDLASAYLRGRPTLKRVCLLIDARHGVKDADRETMKNLDSAAVSYQLVLTKADQLKPAEVARAIAAAEAEARKHGAAYPEALATSSQTGFGIAELRAEIASVAKAVLLVGALFAASPDAHATDCSGASCRDDKTLPTLIQPAKPVPAQADSDRGSEPTKREPPRPPAGHGMMTPPAGR